MKDMRKSLAIALAAAFLSTSVAPALAATTTYSTSVPYTQNWQAVLNQQLTNLGIQLPATTTTPAPSSTQPPAPTPSPTPAPTSDSALLSAPITAEEQQMLGLINKERTAVGASPLATDMRLVKVARMKSLDMIKNNYFGHQSPTYGSPFDLLKSQGITYRYAGENLAGAATVDRAHTILMNSSGHRANILDTRFSKVGIGIIKGGPYGLMISQEFIGY